MLKIRSVDQHAGIGLMLAGETEIALFDRLAARNPGDGLAGSN
jgi:hypothetical protein